MGYLDRLAEIRKRKGLTQAQVAELVGVEQPTYQRWEKGKREPSFGQLFELARVLSVDPSSLIDHSIAANMEILDEMAERRRHQELLDAINSKKIP